MFLITWMEARMTFLWKDSSYESHRTVQKIEGRLTCRIFSFSCKYLQKSRVILYLCQYSNYMDAIRFIWHIVPISNENLSNENISYSLWLHTNKFIPRSLLSSCIPLYSEQHKTMKLFPNQIGFICKSNANINLTP